ncbi:MAG: HIT family protein [Deltaproteobacteria bacterium]|nr:HIT family protein [Deltaproteobacteria bacterium]
MFVLDQRLTEDTAPVRALKLCTVLLMKDSSMPWLILVPQRAGIKEVYELEAGDRLILMEEAARASRVIKALYAPDKINIGSLGNIVTQLHLHVIGRFSTDRAWPGPVWGAGQGVPYSKEGLDMSLIRLRKAFGGMAI